MADKKVVKEVFLNEKDGDAFQDWAYAQQMVAYWKVEELKMRNDITARLLTSPENADAEGNHKYSVSFMQRPQGPGAERTPVIAPVTVERKWNRTLAKKFTLKAEFKPFIKVETVRKLKLVEYREHCEEHPEVVERFSEHLTEKPATPIIKLG
jgi:hypothetical protein